jgi:hypothetical protein
MRYVFCVTSSAGAESAYARVKTNEGRAAFAQLPHKLLRRNEERVLQEEATDVDHLTKRPDETPYVAAEEGYTRISVRYEAV